MTRRIVRTVVQFTVIGIVALVLIVFLDNRYRVLPSRLHNYLPTHHPGLVVTDITLTTCSSISILSGCGLSAGWHRIEKDLYLDKGWFSHAYIQIVRKPEEELLETDHVIIDVRIGRLDPTTSEKDTTQNKWESRPGGIWLLKSAKRHASDSDRTITAVDVLFGADAVEPRTGWEIKDQALLLSSLSSSIPEPRLTIRRGAPTTPGKPTPRVNKNGKFKIIQVSDLHLSTGLGVCRDEYPTTAHCDADPRTLEFVGSVLDQEKPDLAVLSGDQVNGDTSPDAQTAVFKFAELFIKRNIPFAVIFGNHDDEGSLSREATMELVQSLPLSLSEPGPRTVDGVGNYVVEVLARGTSSHSALTLYLLDTHAYSPDEAHYKGYDWIKQSQIDWFKERASSLAGSAAHREYAHTHLNMAFIHIPLPEYREQGKLVAGSGSWREPPTAPHFNSGFKDVLVENDIFAVSCGHDHVNDYCVVDEHSESKAVMDENSKKNSKHKMWMCYAGGSGLGGYAGYGGYKRRVRVWDFDMDGGKVETWKRVDGEEARADVRTVREGGRVLG